MKKIRYPKNPKQPQRICWGCHKLCHVHDMQCGNGTERSQHPAELFGEDWYLSLTDDEKQKIELI